MRITRVMDHEDQIIKMHQIGKMVIIRTERASIARAVLRQVEEAIAPTMEKELKPCIGFKEE